MSKIEKIPVEVEEDLTLTYGTLAHYAFQTFFSTGDADKARELDPELLSHFDNPEFVKVDINRLFNLGLKEVSNLGISLDPKDFYQYEVELETGEEGIGIYDAENSVWLYLRVDLAAITQSGETIIIDWKTTSWDYDEHRIIASQQLDMYAWAYRLLKGHYPDKVAFVTLNKDRLTSESLVKEIKEWQVKETVEKVRQISRAVQAGFFWKNEGACNTRRKGQLYHCPFYQMCWNGREIKVNRDELPKFGR